MHVGVARDSAYCCTFQAGQEELCPSHYCPMPVLASTLDVGSKTMSAGPLLGNSPPWWRSCHGRPCCQVLLQFASHKQTHTATHKFVSKQHGMVRTSCRLLCATVVHCLCVFGHFVCGAQQSAHNLHTTTWMRHFTIFPASTALHSTKCKCSDLHGHYKLLCARPQAHHLASAASCVVVCALGTAVLQNLWVTFSMSQSRALMCSMW